MNKYLVVLTLSLLPFLVKGERIDFSTAHKIAYSVAVGNNPNLRSTNDITLVYAATPGKVGSTLRSLVPSDADYYVFNIGKDNGFVIVSGDDRAYPVLGKNNNGFFDPQRIPEGLQYMLDNYQKEINHAIDKQLVATKTIQSCWKSCLSGSESMLRSSSNGVLLNTALWAQWAPYNRFTPRINGEQAVTGCVATAFAIVMHYHKYPTEVVTNGVSEYYGLPVEYEPYQWDKMPMTYRYGYTEEEANAVAALMWNVGANVNMEYGLESSGTDGLLAIKDARNTFGYSKSCHAVSKNVYNWKEWKSMLRTELDNDCPVYYIGNDSNMGHAFVCDGYSENEFFHFNWGDEGIGNGDFVLSAIDSDEKITPYVNNVYMAIGFRPPREGDVEAEPDHYELRFMDFGPIESFHISVGETFTINPQIINIEGMYYNDYVAMAIIGNDGKMKKLICDPIKVFLKSNFPVYDYNYQCFLREKLEAGEKILPVYSIDNGKSWIVMKGTSTAPLYIDMQGIVIDDNYEYNRVFMKTIEGHIDPMPITGQTGEKIPFTYTINSDYEECKGKELWLSCYMDMTEGFDLYYVEDNGKERKLELTLMQDCVFGTDIKVPQVNIDVGKYSVGKIYHFYLYFWKCPERLTVAGDIPTLGIYVQKLGEQTSNLLSSVNMPHVLITGEEIANATAINDVFNGTQVIQVKENNVYITTKAPCTAYVYTFSGILYRTLKIPAGESEWQFPMGVYIINIGKQSYKVQL